MKRTLVIALALVSALSLASHDVKYGPFDTRKSATPTTFLATGSRQSFDQGKPVNFEGKIVGIEIYHSRQGYNSVDVLVRLSNGGTSVVELGPQPYIEQQRLGLVMNESVSVTGSKLLVNGQYTVVASQLGHNGERIAFRTPGGKPFWK